jgi:16S rRNA G1207 methylase RsmC
MADILFSGCRSGRFPLEYARKHPEDRIFIHTYDCYQARKVGEDNGRRRRNVEVVCASELPQGAVYSEAFYYATSKLVSGELELDTLQDIYLHLAEGAQFTTEGVEPDTLVKLGFSKISSSKASRRAPVKCVCFKKGDLKRVRSFSAVFEASVPGGPKLNFMSLPGCFCHRRPDLGGLSLAEVVSKEIAETDIGSNVPVLDIGCGCGLVGLLVADALRRKGISQIPLALVDSHSRAIAASRQNADSLGIGAECILSDVGLPENHSLQGKFKIALGNPPYYGDGKIADLFAEIAAASLAPDGVCWMVAKSPDIIKEACAKFFGKIDVLKRRGYTVLRARKG